MRDAAGAAARGAAGTEPRLPALGGGGGGEAGGGGAGAAYNSSAHSCSQRKGSAKFSRSMVFVKERVTTRRLARKQRAAVRPGRREGRPVGVPAPAALPQQRHASTPSQYTATTWSAVAAHTTHSMKVRGEGSAPTPRREERRR